MYLEPRREAVEVSLADHERSRLPSTSLNPRTLFFLSLILSWFVPTQATAEPALGSNGIVRIKSRSVLWAEVSPDGSTLDGYLADDRDRRLTNREIEVATGPVVRRARTDADGAFSIPLTTAVGAQTINITFRGDAYQTEAVILREYDPGRIPLRIQLLAPSEVLLNRDTTEVQVRAEQGEQPVEIPVSVALLPRGSILGRGRTTASGWASITIETKAFGGPGRRVLDADFRGDARYAPAKSQARLLVVDVTAVTLVTDRQRLLPDEHLLASGTLSGSAGPLPGEVLHVLAGDRVLSEVVTDAEGRYEARVTGGELTIGEWTPLTARYRSALPWRRPSRSSEVSVTVERPIPMNWGWVFVPLSITVVLLGALLWLSYGRRSKRRRRAQPPERHVGSGLQPEIASARTTSREVYLNLGGQVWDPIKPGPVSGADVRVSQGTVEQREATTEDGRFSFDRLERGINEVNVGAPSYISETFTAEMPHHGAFLDVKLHLIQVRHRALELYRNVARLLLPKARLWGHWTPREIAVHAARQRPALSDELAALTSAFEDVYYSPRANRPEDLREIERLANGLDAARRQHDTKSDGG